MIFDVIFDVIFDKININNLIGVSETTHTTLDSKNVVVSGVDSYFSLLDG